MARFSSSVSARSNGKSKRRYSGATSEPACFARSPTTLRSARWSRCVPVWLRIVAARRSGVDLGGRACRRRRAGRGACPRCTIRPAACVARHALRVGSTSKTTLAVGAPEHAAVADLAAALGVERRPIEHDLGGGARLGAQLLVALRLEVLVLDAVAQDRDDPRLGGRRLVAEERGVADAAPDRFVQRRLLDAARLVGLRARAAALALLGERGLEARAIDARRRTRPPARPSGRSGSRTCRGA